MAEEQTNEVADDRPRSVAELLERITRERGALEQVVFGMSVDALIASSGGWSAKVHLAHVAAWERRLIGELQGDSAAARFGLDEAAYAAADTDVLNAILLARHEDDTPATVRAEFQSAGEALRAAIAELSDADLMQLASPDDPEEETVLDMIKWDTFKHYPEHVAAITGQA